MLYVVDTLNLSYTAGVTCDWAYMLTVACFLFQRCYQSAGKQITHLNIADILKDAQITEFGIVTYFGI